MNNEKSKLMEFGSDGRKRIATGVEKLANAVGATLGPRGRNVILQRTHGSPVSTKDGVSVAREVVLKDPFENIGAQMVKDVAIRTASDAGDGTTTATILAHAIYKQGLELISADEGNSVEIKRGIDLAAKQAVAFINDSAKPVQNNEEIRNIATISANNDSEIGNLIARAIERVTKDGIVFVEESQNAENSIEVVEGMQFKRGMVSPYFTTSQTEMIAQLEDPYILITDQRISASKDIVKILEEVQKQGKSMLIICDDIDSEALALCVVNKVRGSLKVCAVKAPEYGEHRLQMLEDIAALTGGTVITPSKGIKLSGASLGHCGTAKRIKVTKSDTTIVDGKGAEAEISARVDYFKKQIELAESDNEKKRIQDRMARFTGGVAIVRVGANSELELKEKADRVDDALHATKAALEEGIGIGGGIGLLRAAMAIDISVATNDDQKNGMLVLQKALAMPFDLILKNGGLSPLPIKEKILAASDVTFGYNARTDEYVNMFTAGIIDPIKVTRTALENAVSVAGVLLTTECIITPDPEEQKTPVPEYEYQ